MEEKIKRPPSVWIAQIWMLLPALLFGLSLFSRLGPSSLLAGKYPSGMFLTSLYELAASILLFVAVIGMAKRKNVARWLGVVLLSLNCVNSTYTFGQIAMDQTYQSKLMSRETSLVVGIIITSLMLFLIYRLAFGSAANAFFAKPTPGE